MGEIDRQTVFPFLVGSGRSGTTLLRAMFDSHPDMAIPMESHFIVKWAKYQERYLEDGRYSPRFEFFLKDLLSSSRFIKWGLPIDELKEEFAAKSPTNYSDCIRVLFDFYARSRGKTRYGEKTPGYVLHLPLLAELFPEARFIHIIRDGRDVALSYLSLEWGPETIGEAADRWKSRVSAGRSAGAELGPSRYRELRYEDLLEDTESHLLDLSKFVDMDYDESMLSYFERSDQIVAAAKYPHRHQHISRPPAKGLRDWRHEMDKQDVAFFEDYAGDLLKELGYELSGY